MNVDDAKAVSNVVSDGELVMDMDVDDVRALKLLGKSPIVVPPFPMTYQVVATAIVLPMSLKMGSIPPSLSCFG